MNIKKPAENKKPRVTMSKTIRLTREELDHAGKLLQQYPECMSEADLLRQATLLGLYMLAAQATGQPVYGGYQREELVALLKYRVLPVIDFLFEHNAFPALYGMRPNDAIEDTADQGDLTSTQINANAADDLGGLGTDFMDD